MSDLIAGRWSTFLTRAPQRQAVEQVIYTRLTAGPATTREIADSEHHEVYIGDWHNWVHHQTGEIGQVLVTLEARGRATRAILPGYQAHLWWLIGGEDR